MRALAIVFRFEYLGYIKRKSFIALTIGMIVLIAAVLSWPAVRAALGGGPNDQGGLFVDGGITVVALVDEADLAAGNADYYNLALSEMGYRFTQADYGREQAEEMVETGQVDQVVVLTGPAQYIRYVRNVGMYDSFEMVFSEAMLGHYRLDALGKLGVSQADAAGLLSETVQGTLVTVASGKDQMQNFFYTYVLIFILYFSVIMYGNFIATSVATEKSTRAMEILITSVRPRSLMFGKVFGAGLAGLTQIVLVIGFAYMFYNINAAYYQDNFIIQSIFGMPLGILFYTVLFFILGFFMYAFFYAALASVVSRMEELSTTTMPVLFTYIAAFMIVMFSMSSGNVDSALMVACSFIPFTSPMAMFARIAMGDVSTIQIVLSVAILFASNLLVGVLASSVYKLGVLLYGTTPSPRQILRLLRAENSSL